MPNLKDIIELAGKILLVPAYYTDNERNISIGLSILMALIGFFVARRIIEQNRWTFGGAALVAIAAFVIYYLVLYNTGGIFIFQSICRAIFFCVIAFLAPYSKKKQ